MDIFAVWNSEGGINHEGTWLDETPRGVGYIREPGGSGPFAARYFVQEAFEFDGVPRIPAKLLRERLPETLRRAERRLRAANVDAAQIEKTLQSFRDFVDFCERCEAEDGQAVQIYVA